MKLRVQYAGGLCTTYIEARIPLEGEIYKGEIVEKVARHDPPRNGFDAYVYLKVPE